MRCKIIGINMFLFNVLTREDGFCVTEDLRIVPLVHISIMSVGL